MACSGDIAQVIPTGSENNSHQAISNLQFLSKIIEKAVYQQLNNYFNHWMCQNCFQLNNEKTEVMVFGARDEQLKVSAQLLC